MRTVGQKGLYNLFKKSQAALIVICVICIGLVESKDKVRIFSKRKNTQTVEFEKKYSIFF